MSFFASEPAKKKPEYGNWVSAKLVYIPGAVVFLFLGLSMIGFFRMIDI